MRMSCNSTYLLDQQTDHGVKADELTALLEQLFVMPEAKAVVFSQWTRTHDIVIRRLEARGIGYVSFHGGVPSEKRPCGNTEPYDFFSNRFSRAAGHGIQRACHHVALMD